MSSPAADDGSPGKQAKQGRRICGWKVNQNSSLKLATCFQTFSRKPR
ncbi:MAG TPA: hypothetical protein VMG82_32840 [Candidatus Sulfotelmatobacter sp.]|nr:hypothetical protein [Candidatus Sulfotelmatobacter sp.]